MKVVIGQGSCGIATGAKKTEAEFRKQIAEHNLDVCITLQAAQAHVIWNRLSTYMTITEKILLAI